MLSDPTATVNNANNLSVFTVLVVDDDEVLRIVFRMELEKAGYGVLEAENGQAGFIIAGDNHPNLIITDIMMPVLDGIGLIDKIRNSNSIRSTPIIAISAERDPAISKRALERGANEFISKPISPGGLLRSVGKYLSC